MFQKYPDWGLWFFSSVHSLRATGNLFRNSIANFYCSLSKFGLRESCFLTSCTSFLTFADLMAGTRVFFDISINNQKAGRIVFEVSDVCTKEAFAEKLFNSLTIKCFNSWNYASPIHSSWFPKTCCDTLHSSVCIWELMKCINPLSNAALWWGLCAKWFGWTFHSKWKAWYPS